MNIINIYHQRNRAAIKKEDKILIIILIFILLFDFLLFPLPILAKDIPIKDLPQEFFNINTGPAIKFHLPETSNIIIKKRAYYTFTAYNSEPGQTDNSPCVTANGFNLCEHGTEDTIAANHLKFGTKVRIPELFGDQIFIVRDRMNPRYASRIDIWMAEKQTAKEFGVRRGMVEIIEILE